MSSDDVKIFCQIFNGLGALQLQKNLLAFKEWFKKWILRFNGNDASREY